jgi:hypothetical protein
MNFESLKYLVANLCRPDDIFFIPNQQDGSDDLSEDNIKRTNGDYVAYFLVPIAS